MRTEPRALLLLLLAPSCAVDLGPGETAPPPSTSPAILSDCLPLTRTLESFESRLDAQLLLDGTLLVGAGDYAFSVDRPVSLCEDSFHAAFTPPLFDGRGLVMDATVTLLAGVGSRRFFSADGVGIGVAEWHSELEQFVALSLLFTADRPRFGSAAVRVDDDVYVFGGLPARFLSADVFLARAPIARLAEPAAYEYWQGGGGWTEDADSAAPVVEGGTSPSVVYDAAHNRWLMAYATPLAREIQVRSGLGVTGPWSRPIVLGGCRLPPKDTQAFCDDVTLLPSLGSASIEVGYRVGSFASEPREPRAYWTRLASTAWPTTLP